MCYRPGAGQATGGSISSIGMTQTETPPALDRLMTWSLAHPVPKTARYAIATVLIVGVGMFRLLFVASIVPWLLFIPFILAIGFLLGRNPGLYATGLAAIVAALSIGGPGEPFWLNASQWIGSLIFITVACGIALLTAEMHATLARARGLTIEKDLANARLAEREAFLSSILASSTDCITVLDLEARVAFMSQGGRNVMEVTDFNDVIGRPWSDLWQGAAQVDAAAAIAAARAGESRSFVGPADTMAGTRRWWHVAVSPIVGVDGAAERILAVSRDITSSRGNEEERNQLARIVENSADFIGMARLDGEVFFLNDAACRLVGLDRERVGRVMITDFFPPEDAAIVRDVVLPAVERTGSWSGERQFRHFRTGALIPVLYTVFPVHDHDGSVIGYGTVTRDFTARKRAEEQQILLNNELGHRLKNVLTVVQSVAAQTLRQAESLPAANAALAARLAALGQAADILTAKSWNSADLGEVVSQALAPHAGVGDRLRVSGPAITLLPQVTLALALALHELATNAAKYGALSNETGHVDLSWAVGPGPDGAAPRFALTWTEINGPPVRPPARRGFGTLMIERSLRSYFRGTATLDYIPSGLRFELESPLADAGKLVEPA